MAQTSATSFASLFKKPHVALGSWIWKGSIVHVKTIFWGMKIQYDSVPVVGLLESGLQLLTNEMTLKKNKVLSNTSGHEEHKWTRLMSQKQLGSKQQTWNKCCTYHRYSEINSGNWATNHPTCSMYGIFTNIYPINHPNVGKYTIHGAFGHVWKILHPPKSAVLRIFRSLDLREPMMLGAETSASCRTRKPPLFDTVADLQPSTSNHLI